MKRIAIVTGASSGMGRLFALYAKHFFDEIDEIWLIGRNIDRLKKVKNKLTVPARIMSVDLSTIDGVNELSSELELSNYKIKLLVNSAGLGIIGKYETLNDEDIHNMVSVNAEGLSLVISKCLAYMDTDSHIINIASAAAFSPQPEFAVYAATKSYVLSLSLALSKELKSDRIYVTAVCPGCVDTPFFDVAQKYSKIKSYKKYFMAKDKKVVIKAYKDAKNKSLYSIYGISMKLLYLACKILPARFIMMFM